MKVENSSTANKYIKKITLNGKLYLNPYLMYADIVNGGILNIKMGQNPPKKFGIAVHSRPLLFNKQNSVVRLATFVYEQNIHLWLC